MAFKKIKPPPNATLKWRSLYGAAVLGDKALYEEIEQKLLNRIKEINDDARNKE